MDDVMAAQEHVALARSLLDLYNRRQSDPAWLGKGMAALAAAAKGIEVSSGGVRRCPDGHKRRWVFLGESLRDSRIELSNAFATEDQVVLEGTWRWNDTGPLPLPSGALPLMRRSGELGCCLVFQIRKGKIASLHHYDDMVTLMEQLGLVPAWGQAT